MKKIISMILSLSVAASFMTFANINAGAASIPTPQGTTLFEDNFDSYTNGVTYSTSTWGKIAATDVTNDFKYVAGWGGTAPTAAKTGYSALGDLTKVMQLATDSGIGSGNSLKITAQSDVLKNMLIKNSGITSDAISGKRIIFKTTFKVPSFVGFGDAVGVYLKPTATTYEAYSDVAATFRSDTADYKNGELMHLGAKPVSTVTGGSTAYAGLSNGTRNNELWTFGEKVADLTAGTVYTYTVTMTPNTVTGKYDVETDLNGSKLTLGQSAYASSSTVPAIADMANFATVSIMRMTHPSYFQAGNANNNLTGWLAGAGANLGITTTDGLYDNNRTVAYFDDMSMKAVEIQDTVFEDDFESYTKNPTYGRSWTWGRKAELFDFDDFRYTWGTVNEPNSNAVPSWITTASDQTKIAVIDNNTDVGTGNALKLTGQPAVPNYALAKKSHLDTADIAGRKLEFRADFKAPISGIAGEGFGVWVMSDNGTDIYELSSAHPELYIGTAAADSVGEKFYKGEFMYVGTRKAVEDYTLNSIKYTKDIGYGDKAARATYLYVFGEEVARLNPDAIYDIKVTLTPSGTGYKAAVTLNGITTALAGTNLPTQAEMATFKRLYATPISRAWMMENVGGGLGLIKGLPAFYPEDVFDENGAYKTGRTIGIIDNISLISTTDIEAPVADVAANMVAVNTGWASDANTFISALATVEGTTATVEVRSNRTSAITPVIVAAAYDGYGRLIDAVINGVTTVPALGTETATLTGLPESYSTVKVFMWDTLANITPLTAVFSK